MKKALIIGITGQDGYFLSRLLLEKKYKVFGIAPKNKNFLGVLEFLPAEKIRQLIIYKGDIIDYHFIKKIIKKYQFDEIYHLAAQSSVGKSFRNPDLTYKVNINGTLNIINAIKEESIKSKMYFAASSELFGRPKTKKQNENSPFYPMNPYAISKLAGFWMVKNYRENYKMFISNGILFNHESEFRGPEFVTKKISAGVARIKYGFQKDIKLGNLDVRRDWGYSKDYVEGIWKILQHKNPDDFILATGKNHSIREFVEEAFRIINIDIIWRGKELNEIGIDKKTRKILVRIDPDFFRPNEVGNLIGDYSKAKKLLRWKPKTTFKKLVLLMVKADLERLKND